MAPPFLLSSAEFADKPHIRWNAFLDLAFSRTAGLTPVQRHAAVALSYLCEGGNNGNLGVFCYLHDVSPEDLMSALTAIGAENNLAVVQKIVSVLGTDLPSDAIARDERVMELWSDKLNECELVDTDELQNCLEGFLDQHETEFLKWTD